MIELDGETIVSTCKPVVSGKMEERVNKLNAVRSAAFRATSIFFLCNEVFLCFAYPRKLYVIFC